MNEAVRYGFTDWDIILFESGNGHHGVRIYNEGAKIDMKFSLNSHIQTIMANIKRECDGLPKAIERDLIKKLLRIKLREVYCEQTI